MQIYQILNKVTNKSYVGKSKDYKKRFKNHLKCAGKKVNRRLYDSINKHGKENFELILLEDLGDVTRKEANTKETYWIDKLNTLMPYGYNMTKGGDGGNTLDAWSAEDKKKLWAQQGEKRRGKRPVEFSRSMSEAATEREASKSKQEKEAIAGKISQTLKEKYKSGEIVAITPKFYGEDHPGYVSIDIHDVLSKVKACWTLKKIAEMYETSTVTVGTRLKTETGKTFLEWRREYGISGKLCSPRIK